jgi:putative FmdB family regulatory protein
MASSARLESDWSIVCGSSIIIYFIIVYIVYNEGISSRFPGRRAAGKPFYGTLMPIFEYRCKDCGRVFETLVMGSKQPECPACHGQQLDQMLSTFSARATTSLGPASMPTAPCGAPAGACGGSPTCGLR